MAVVAKGKALGQKSTSYLNNSIHRAGRRIGAQAHEDSYKWWALSCTSLGMLLATYLNRVVDPNNHGDVDKWISYARTRDPFALLPEQRRETFFSWVRSKFKSDEDFSK